MTLYFDLHTYVDSAAGDLLKRVDRRVATYYLALPLAGEGNRVTVATAYPENAAALRVLERLLQADVVTVSSTEKDLHEAIARVYPEIVPGEGAVLAWTDDPAWSAIVIETANAFGRAAARPVINLDAIGTLDDVPARGEFDFSLLVVHVSDDTSLERLIRRSPVSLLVVRGQYAPVDHVLVVLRGFGSDLETLDRVLPILTMEGAGATFLPLAWSGATRRGLPGDNAPARQHLREFLGELDRRNIQVAIRMSHDDPAGQIVAELTDGRHAMLIMAAEAEGDFVWQVMSRIERERQWPNRPVLVIKPPVWMGA